MLSSLLALTVIAAAPEPTPTFRAVSPAAVQPTGRLVRLTPDLTAVLLTPGETGVPNVISLRRTDRPVPSFPTGPQLITATGDRIAGILQGGDAQWLRFAPRAIDGKDGEGWRVPLSACGVLWLSPVPADTPLDPARYEFLADVRNRDVVRFRNGDISRGTLAGLDAASADPVFTFRPDQGSSRPLRTDELAAVAFNPTLARTRKPKGPYVRATLADGSRLQLTSPTVAAGKLGGDTLFGLKVTLPLAEVVSLDVMQGKAIYLSDLKPKKVEQAGYLGVTWPWAADRSVAFGPLRLATPAGVEVFDKGLGTHPRTLLAFDLGGKYRRFEALVGLAPGAAVRGRAAVRVLVDGKEADLPGLTSLKDEKAIPVQVNVSGAQELTLVADFGPAGGVGADVNWGDARLVE
jgi:hypothetical protein